MEKLVSILSIVNYLIDRLFSVGRWIQAHNAFITAAATAVIAIFTWALVCANRKLWQVSLKTANAAEKAADVAWNTMEHTQRAYIFIKEIIHSVKQTEGFGEVIIVLENTGETPVRKMICNYNYCCFPGDIPGDFKYPDTIPLLYGVIGRKTILDARVLIPFNAFEDARTKKQRFYIYGWVDYNDVFPNTPRHRTESCYEVIISKDRKFIYNIYGNYNGSDDECSRKPSPYVPPS